MEDVILSYDDKNIDFSNIGLCTPSSIHGGSYFTKIQYCKKPLYMQSPKCTSKQGIVHSGKKTYIDLVFTSEKDGDFISFLENLEKKCIDIIYEKRHVWFTDDLEKTDIETAFASVVKSYKNGTSHTLRVYINNGAVTSKFNGISSVQSCFIFDEDNNSLSFDSIKPEMSLITIIDFEGIKFTSKSFQFEINARQMLVINERPIFKACLIKHKKQEHSQDEKCHDDAAAAEAEAQGQAQAQAASSTTDNVSVVTNAPDVSGSAKVIENASETPSSPLKQHLETLEISSSSSSSSKEVEAEADVVAVVPELVPTTIVEESSKDATKPRHLEEEKEVKEVKEVKEDSSTTKNNDSSVNENKSDTTESNSNKNCELVEVTLDLEKDDKEKLVLKNPEDVYYKMYKEAKIKAKAAKNVAIEAYLAAEEIKLTYNLNSSDSSDTESDDSESSENDA